VDSSERREGNKVTEIIGIGDVGIQEITPPIISGRGGAIRVGEDGG